MKKILPSLVLFLTGVVSLQGAALVPFLPGNGVAQLLKSEYRCDYWALTRYFDTQITNTFCGVASSTMVLNALEIEKPVTGQYGDYALFTQEGFFTDAVSKIVSIDEVKKRGMTLDELSAAVNTFSVKVETHHAEDESVEIFRERVKSSVKQKNRFVITNFHRPVLGQKGGGHFSPIAAYSEDEDRVLVLDVSRYKTPPFWVTVDDLWESMLQVDSSSKRSRGYLEVSSIM